MMQEGIINNKKWIIADAIRDSKAWIDFANNDLNNGRKIECSIDILRAEACIEHLEKLITDGVNSK